VHGNRFGLLVIPSHYSGQSGACCVPHALSHAIPHHDGRSVMTATWRTRRLKSITMYYGRALTWFQNGCSVAQKTWNAWQCLTLFEMLLMGNWRKSMCSKGSTKWGLLDPPLRVVPNNTPNDKIADPLQHSTGRKLLAWHRPWNIWKALLSLPEEVLTFRNKECVIVLALTDSETLTCSVSETDFRFSFLLVCNIFW